MHVDGTEFTRLMLGEEVAAAIHETWRELARQQGWSMQPHLARPYAALAEADKDDNRAAALRIADVLALAGLGLRRAGDGDEVAIPEAEWQSVLTKHLELMAEAEHNGWMAHKARNGWQYDAVRDDALKHHHLMVPYADLAEGEKDKDRDSIRHYPDFAARANHRIVRLV